MIAVEATTVGLVCAIAAALLLWKVLDWLEGGRK
jgi:hypothetical protein